MEKYLNGRIKAYDRLFTEISPPIPQEYADSVSYTHLDVYKRQMYMSSLGNRPDLFPQSGYVSKYYENPPADYEVPAALHMA